jgi:CheY-like chemotaxis protein/predicted transcriptional regulator
MNQKSLFGSAQDRVGGQRSKHDVIATILVISQEPSLKNHIIGKGNFSDSMANHYLSILLYHKMLASAKDKSGRTYYTVTDKGRQYLSHYNDIQDLFLPEKNDDKVRNVLDSKAVDQRNGPADAGDDVIKSVNKRILIVDDESDISSAMQIGLEEQDFIVDTFNDPVSALAAYKPQSYDLLLLDVRMPVMNGFELYRKIKEIDNGAKVCFLTAFEVYSEEFKKVFPSMNVQHLIQKPVSMAELVQQIRTLTEER